MRGLDQREFVVVAVVQSSSASEVWDCLSTVSSIGYRIKDSETQK